MPRRDPAPIEDLVLNQSTRTRVIQVDSKDSLENVESKWVSEIADNCRAAKLVLVALKCDLREKTDEGEDGEADAIDGEAAVRVEKPMIDYHQGLEVARRIGVRQHASRGMHEMEARRLTD